MAGRIGQPSYESFYADVFSLYPEVSFALVALVTKLCFVTQTSKLRFLSVLISCLSFELVLSLQGGPRSRVYNTTARVLFTQSSWPVLKWLRFT